MRDSNGGTCSTALSRRFRGFGHAFQSEEGLVPIGGYGGDPKGGFGEPFGLGVITDLFATTLRSDQADTLQMGKVFDDGLAGERKVGGQGGGGPVARQDEPFEDGAAVGVGEGDEHIGVLRQRRGNHAGTAIAA